ncbi:MAG TPA: TonB-dependent receptor [Hyphomicrobium sp.]|uniref:TonB-dependent receptor family protein n=1 Tax=Hyphomicrobium sp. TaxID=82 RepID=UPI002BD2FCAB|nr:TonB-dependent receptor [Hyphomicrobium sp.]HRN89175.1 TonB-dependent receptor [Hyphomicrobium sp.]
MLVRRQLMLTVMAGAVGLMTSPVFAQEAAQPADGALPEVEVIQKKAPAAAKRKAAPAPKAASPAPQPPPAYDYVDAAPPAARPGERGSDGRVVDNQSSISPVDPSRGILPEDTQNFAGSATHVTSEQISEIRPKDNAELLSRVPGVTFVQDDGMGRHINIGVRGSPNRRARKVLVMEDGFPINFATYLDPSTHYTPPVHRVESIEVMRGPIVAYGPLTNHGVVNFRNLNPFGANETVITAAIGHTKGADYDVNNYRHVHTRQNFGNVGVVASYTGGDAGGAWSNEESHYNDFYGALAWRGFNQDLTISGGYHRQRDHYDESNFTGTEEDFYRYGRQKPNRPGTGFGLARDTRGDQTNLNRYLADLYRIQGVHNWYIDTETTITTRLYYSDHSRDRPHSRRLGPINAPADGAIRSRNRDYTFWGVESRFEKTNIPLFAGVTFDVQTGIRYEEQKFENCNTSGRRGEYPGSSFTGHCLPSGPNNLREDTQLSVFEADAFAAFLQVPVHLTNNLTVTPGVRFENYDITGERIFNAGGFLNPPTRVDSDHNHVLPSVGFAWETMPRSTVYGGYHQGITPMVVRNPSLAPNSFPLPDEKGDNFEIGFRSTAVRGLTLDFAYFHSKIDNYQVKAPVSDPVFNNSVYGIVDEVEINGFEIYTRLDSQPYTGGSFNVFGEATFTYADNEIKRGTDTVGNGATLNTVDVSGNKVPEVPRHFANLTLGVEEKGLWSASITGTYIGEFFTDARNTHAWTCVDSDFGHPVPCAPAGGGVVTKVDGQWLLSARADYQVPNTGVTLFVSGQNLTDEFYIADTSDGAKPGVGRTLWAGFTWKFDN